MKNQSAEQLKRDLSYTARIRKSDVTFHTVFGVFSPKGIDDGTYLLHHKIHLQGDESILDLGCGYGALGVPMALEAGNGRVLMTDSNVKAIELANKNIAANGVTNATALLSFGFQDIPQGEMFDLVVSNLPANVGRELLFILLSDARDHLKPGGSLYVVTIAGLRDFIKTNFEKVFGNYEKVEQHKGYVVARATKV